MEKQVGTMCIRIQSGDGHVGIHDGRPYFSCGVSRRSMQVLLPIAFAMVSYTHPFLRPIISSPANPLYFPSPPPICFLTIGSECGGHHGSSARASMLVSLGRVFHSE